MKINKLVIALSCINLLITASSYPVTIKLEGGPAGGGFEETAPIFTLNGRALSSILVGDVNGDQDLTFSMDNVNGGKVYTKGSMHLTAEDWDAWFDVDSIYLIKGYGDLIVATFNHKLKKDSDQECIISGKVAKTGEISSEGSMVLVQEDFTFDGIMRGTIKAWADLRKKSAIVNRGYPDPRDTGDRIVSVKGKRYETFTQSFTDIVVEDQGVWSASYTFNEAKGKLSGKGTIVVGPQDKPVDTVAQKVSGTKKGGIYSWTTTSNSRLDAKVKVTIKNTDTDVVDGANSVSAAAQTRKF